MALARDHLLAVESEQRGQEFSPGQIAGRSEDHHGERLGVCLALWQVAGLEEAAVDFVHKLTLASQWFDRKPAAISMLGRNRNTVTRSPGRRGVYPWSTALSPGLAGLARHGRAGAWPQGPGSFISAADSPPIRPGRPCSSSIGSVSSAATSVRNRLGFIITRPPPRLR